MADILQVDEQAADDQLQAYYDEIDDLTGLALAGVVNEQEFISEMERITLAALLLMFLLGGGSVAAADDALAEQRQIAARSARVLVDDIFSGRYSPQPDEQTADEGREKLRNRLALWTFTLGVAYATGQVNTGRLLEPVYEWRLGNTERHCTDCLNLNGVALTESEWQRLGIRPQSFDLECGGWRCDCRLRGVVRQSIGFENVPLP